MRAIVFSGGGMFGAYHVGAWKVLSRVYKPDLVVGVSIGSLNAWMVACGCDAGEIEKHWLEGESLERASWRWPRSWRHGLLNPSAAHEVMRRMHRELKPILPLGIVVRRLPLFRPVVFRGEAISSWRHLAASCAIPLVFDLQQFDGVTYADGGLFDPLPFFAARDMGADSMLGVNCMTWGGFGFDAPRIQPRKRLGLTPREALCWNRRNVERWIAQGEEDAEAFLAQYPAAAAGVEKTFAENLF